MLDHELESYMSYLYFKRRLNIAEMADDLGCSKATVSRLAKKYKIPLKLNKSRIPHTKYGFGNLAHLIITISSCIKAGMSKKQIAENLGCSRRTVFRICEKYSI